jgi:pimeloyl-ACP methyl ester carboxylesterase
MTLAHDDTGGTGPLVLLVPGAGDIRSEYRFLAPALAEAGYRVVTADLPGHGGSDIADRYGIAETGRALLDLIDHLGGGPVSIIGCSFAPAAAIWAATERPAAVADLVLISPHLTADGSLKARFQNLAVSVAIRGPWAAGVWAKFYRGWYPTSPPADLDSEIAALRLMLADSARRKAVRETLTASREGMEDRMAALDSRSLLVFGSADDHFSDPTEEAATIAERIGSQISVIDGAGHYPHVERADVVAPIVVDFLTG